MYCNLRLTGPSTNPLMTADEYARNRRTEANAMRVSVERTLPTWDDAATPRTDRPVTLSRTGPTPASQWGICRVIRAARASFPFGPQS